MKLSEIKLVISQVIAEAKESGLPKSGGKLVHLKKELASLKQMQESVSQLTMNEANSSPLVAEYAHMQKYVNELEKIKAASAKLSEMLGGQITEVEGKISSETEKIKEMMGLIEKAPKAPKKAPKKDEDQEEKYVGDDEKYEFEKGKKAEKKIEKNQKKKPKELKEYDDDDDNEMSEYVKEQLFKQLMKAKVGSELFKSIKKDLVDEMGVDQFNSVYNSMKLNNEGLINESPTMDFINAIKDLDPAALTALGISALPMGAAIKVIADFVKDKRPMKDKLEDYGNKVALNK